LSPYTHVLTTGTDAAAVTVPEHARGYVARPVSAGL